MGSIDHPFNPLALCMGADATFVARAMDRDPIQLRTVLAEANKHKGTSLVEIYQNCNVFNDGAFFVYTEKSTKPQSTLFVEHGQPLVFGENKDKGIKLDGFKPVVVDLNDPNVSMDDLWVHDQYDKMKATLLTRIFEDNKANDNELPRPFGIFYQEDRYLYEDALEEQIQLAKKLKGEGDLDSILAGSNTWKIN
jgi:2-oxoglutarate ferredoxin oxidoreductase subunit beta